jgi:uncharacterized protein Smg (DUF494 family)
VSGCKRTIPNQRKMMNIMKEIMNMNKTNYNLDDIKWSLMINQLRDNIDINKMSQDNISELLLDNRKIIGSKVYLQKDHNT